MLGVGVGVEDEELEVVVGVMEDDGLREVVTDGLGVEVGLGVSEVVEGGSHLLDEDFPPPKSHSP